MKYSIVTYVKRLLVGLLNKTKNKRLIIIRNYNISSVFHTKILVSSHLTYHDTGKPTGRGYVGNALYEQYIKELLFIQ